MSNMNLANKFRINTEDFRIYFDNTKKTHVCENLETGEKTNIGCIGILMQMGILQPVDNDRDNLLLQRINDLEDKVNDILKKINSAQRVGESKVERKTTPKIREKEDFDIKEDIMEKTLKRLSEDKEKQVNDVRLESEEEIDNWMDI